MPHFFVDNATPILGLISFILGQYVGRREERKRHIKK